MTFSGTSATRLSPASERIDWVDYAKGICIIMVVMMHSTLGVEKAAGKHGCMHLVVEFARPFRMPDFFLISGLFLSRRHQRAWRPYLDRKVVHFAYFYVLWLTIQFAIKAPALPPSRAGAASAHVFACLHRAVRHALVHLDAGAVLGRDQSHAAVPLALIWSPAAALEMAHIYTGWTAIDEFAAASSTSIPATCSPICFRAGGSVRANRASRLPALRSGR